MTADTLSQIFFPSSPGGVDEVLMNCSLSMRAIPYLRPSLLNLPDDILLDHILTYLTVDDVLSLRQVGLPSPS